jgi:hypothetical protein
MERRSWLRPEFLPAITTGASRSAGGTLLWTALLAGVILRRIGAPSRPS